MVRGQAFEDVCEIGKGLDNVEDAGLDQRIGDGRGAAAALGAGEEPVFSADGALAEIIVDLEDAVIRIGGEREPVRERVVEDDHQGTSRKKCSQMSALLSSASMHDSLAAIPLSLMTAQRVTNCNELMNAAYCSSVLREHGRSLGHVTLIDHNPRKGEKIEFTPSEAQRYKERSQAERKNARLKGDFGGRHLRVRGHAKVMSHLTFGMLALTADQTLRLLT